MLKDKLNLVDNKQKIAIFLSGGVDSAVASLIVKAAGLQPIGVTLRLIDNNFDPQNPAADICQKAANLCTQLQMQHIILDLTAEFDSLVLQPFRQNYFAGITPSPCVYCNPELKLGLACALLEQQGFDYFVTGHYAQLQVSSIPDYPLQKYSQPENLDQLADNFASDLTWRQTILNQDKHNLDLDARIALKRPLDRSRDQSPFLYRVPQKRLWQLFFPLGAVADKKLTRKIAGDANLACANQADSQDLCFSTAGYRQILNNVLTDQLPTGNIVYKESGKVVGQHQGVWNYTIGQRKGLGIAWQYPLYVVEIDPVGQTVYVGARDLALRHEVRAKKPVYHCFYLDVGSELRGKVRSGGEGQDCVVKKADGSMLEVFFPQPIFAPTPGQHLVLYRGDELVAGGEIVLESEKY